METAFGVPDSSPRCPRVKLASKGVERLAAPDWFRKMVKLGAKPEKVLVSLRGRVSRGENLHTTKLIINEIGRLPGGASLIARALTQEVVFKLQQPKKKEGYHARR
jgi:hypothetical protein